MSEWKPFTLPMIDGVDDALAAADSAVGVLTDILDVLAGLIDTLLGLVSDVAGPVDNFLDIIQALVDQIILFLNSGIYFYIDKGPYFVAAQPDGLAGFLTRWEESFDDAGDKHRPQSGGGTGVGDSVSAMLFLVGGNSIIDLAPALAALGKLFSVPALELEEPALDYPASVEQSLSTPPDWASRKLGDVLPPFEKLGQVLQQVLGMLAVGDSYAKMLEDLAGVIAAKAAALGVLADEIQGVVDDIEALIATGGLYVLHVEAAGIPDLVQAVKDAGAAPPWNAEAYVTGVCLLGGTADFGDVVELLGG